MHLQGYKASGQEESAQRRRSNALTPSTTKISMTTMTIHSTGPKCLTPLPLYDGYAFGGYAILADYLKVAQSRLDDLQ